VQIVPGFAEPNRLCPMQSLPIEGPPEFAQRITLYTPAVRVDHTRDQLSFPRKEVRRRRQARQRRTQ